MNTTNAYETTKREEELKYGDNIKNYEFLFQLIKERGKTEFASSDKKDEKAIVLFGFNSIVLSIIFSLGLNNSFFNNLGILFILISIVLSFFVIKVRTYRADPDPESLWKKYREKDYETILKQVIVNLIDSFKENKKVIDEKGKFVNISYLCSIIGMFLFFLGILWI